MAFPQFDCTRPNPFVTTRGTGQEVPMTKHVEIDGHSFKLYSLDKGRIWSSSPRSIVAYGRRKNNC
jgi:hypothetical protein